MISGEQQIEGGNPLPPGARVPAAISVSRTGPTVLRMVLGAALRQYREAAGLSTAQAAFKIRATHSKISRMELGRVAAKQRDVGDLLSFYGVTDEDERERLIELVSQSAAPGRWHQYADVLPDWFERYIGLERGAAEIRGYQVQFVPGLLQTSSSTPPPTSMTARSWDTAPSGTGSPSRPPSRTRARKCCGHY